MKVKHERVAITKVYPATWTTTRHTKRQAAALHESITRYGQLQPVVVRETPSGLEVVDGSARFVMIHTLRAADIDVTNLGAIDDAEAREVHLALNLDRGKSGAVALADALQNVMDAQVTERAKALKEVALLASLPLSRQGVDKTVAKLRSKGQSQATHNPASQPSWVDFRFKVDHSAAQVCDQALSDVEQSTGCQRSVAFERICADYLAGPSVGRQP